MKNRRKKVIIKLIVWFVAEIYLNFIGLDDLADYSEFIFEKTISTLEVAIVHNKVGNSNDFLAGQSTPYSLQQTF